MLQQAQILKPSNLLAGNGLRDRTVFRTGLACVVGCLAGAFAYWHITTIAPPGIYAYDFSWAYRGARALLAHQNPYDVILPTGPFPFNSAFKYPLTLAVLSLPFADLSPSMAVALFGAVGAALFTWGLTRDGYWRLPLLASAPCLSTLAMGQSSLLIVSAALLPSIAWLGFCVKPTTALAAFAYRPSWRAIVAACAFGAACLVLVPTWPFQWLEAMLHDPTTHWYVPAVMIGKGSGVVLLLAAFRWKTPEGRLLLTMAVVPQVQVFYSGLVVLLVARTYREALALSLLSSVGYLGWLWYDGWMPQFGLDPAPNQAPWLLLFVYVPALVLTLRRPNVS